MGITVAALAKNVAALRIKLPLLPLVLISILFLRAISLETGDLLDPTETRYATIAQNMLFSGDWVTPRLQTESGLEPYLSKPPLHFWLTALSYKALGIDEWTSRLPSFLGLLLITGSILVFANTFFNRKIGYIASIVCLTSPLMFFLGGSSTVDVTFAAFVTAALVAFAVAVHEKSHSMKSSLVGLLFFLFCALAFLTKGPAGLILIGLPIFALCCFNRSLASLRRLPWAIGTLLFLATAVPWFYLLEQATPGSTWYFFAHENFLRFLVKDYGGRHGAAHIRPYGSIWWMLALSILPWSLLLVRDLLFRLRNFKNISLANTDQWLFFVLACGISPIVFFTFARSILPAYTLPAIPALALYLGYLIHSAVASKPDEDLKDQSAWPKIFSHNYFPCTAKTGTAITAVMFIGLYVAAPMIEVDKSAAEILEVIADDTNKRSAVVGTIKVENKYSPFWTSGAHKEELSKPLRISYASQHDLKKKKYRHLIIRDSESPDFERVYNQSYKKVASRGRWSWFRRHNSKNR